VSPLAGIYAANTNLLTMASENLNGRARHLGDIKTVHLLRNAARHPAAVGNELHRLAVQVMPELAE
jgi:hypothetical protein